MTLPTAAEITNLYLYGQKTTPSNLISDGLIRPTNIPKGNLPLVYVSTQEFMTTGAGRFAVGRQFEIVNDFFTADSSLLPPRYNDGDPSTPDYYTKAEIAAIFGLTSYEWAMQQYNYQDGTDDYAERTYIYNSESFKLADDVRFVVKPSGERSIENFGVVPKTDENFDFVGGGLAVLVNPLIEPSIDPSGIGRTVNINFTGDVTRTTYDGNSYFNDLGKINSWSGFDPIKLVADVNQLIDNLWTSGVTKFLTADGKPILYGTDAADTIDAGNVQLEDLYPTLAPYYTNGVILIGGSGADTLTGGGGNDIFYFASGDGFDTIADEEDGDRIVLSSTKLVNGVQTTNEGELTGIADYLGEGLYEIGNDYLLKIGNDLFVENGVGYIKIDNFFDNTYDPTADYSYMGITIPADALPEDVATDNIDTTTAVSDVIEAANVQFISAVNASLRIDPLIIDTSGNGIALDSFANSGALFDLNGDGTKENTGWTKAGSDDSFLVIDKNSNGNIDDISEMFGNATTAGFVELAKYDSNSDNLINASDSQFGLLNLWNDANGNGTVDAGEMTTLAANNITQISLNKYNSIANIEGNLQTAISTVTMNGVTKNIHELSFAFEDTTTVFNNPDTNLPADFQLDINTILLPFSRGYGSLYSWQAAETLDPQLLLMAQDIAATTPNNFYQLTEKFENFLYRWAGVENVTTAIPRLARGSGEAANDNYLQEYRKVA